MKWTGLVIVFLSLVSMSVAFPVLNEVMYAPTDNFGGSRNEWVELFNPNNDSYNFSGCTFQNKNFTGIINSTSYFILARNKINFTAVYNFSPVVEVKFGSLNNPGDNLTLKCPGGQDNMTYNNRKEYESKTLEKRSDGQWNKSIVDGGTPGRENSNFHLSDDNSGLQISEIYPNTLEDDAAEKQEEGEGGEWVELYNPSDRMLDVNRLVLKDQTDWNELIIADDKVFHGTIIFPHSYLVVYRDGDTDFALNNHGYEEIRLFDGDTILDNMSYSNTVEGMSLSRVGNAFFTTIPTPGEPNDLEQSCDWFLDAYFSDVIIYNNSFELQLEVGRSYGFPQNLTVQGTFQDLGGNVVQTYIPWNDEYVLSGGIKNYKPRLPSGTYEFTFSIENLSCEDDYPNDNGVNGVIVVNAPPSQNTSSLTIEQLYMGNDQSVEWGDQFTAKVTIYKADESKYSVQLWAEKDGQKISPITKANIYDSFVTYPLTLPVQLDANCDEALKDGTATLVLEAFDVRTEKKFSVKGLDHDICEEYRASAPKKSTSRRTAEERYQLLEVPAFIAPGDALRLHTQLLNDDKAHTYTLYGYLYRGNKCYSCLNSTVERDHSLQTVALKPEEAKMVSLLLKADESMGEGEYKVKVKIRKDAQKTEQELTSSIYIQRPASLPTSQTVEAPLTTSADGDEISGAVPATQRHGTGNGIIVYQSTTEKARALIPLIIAGTFGLLSLILVLRQFQNT